MPKIPDWRAPAEQIPFLRWAQDEISRLSALVDRQANSSGNVNRTQTATLEVLGRNIVDLQGRVDQAIAAISLDMSQVPTGDLDQSRVTGTWTKGVTTSGALSTSATVTADAGVSSLGVTTTNVTLLPGGRAAVWANFTAGVFGQTVSTITQKANLADVPYTAAQFLDVVPYVFEYMGQIDIRDNPENPYYDPDYRVPLEIGLMAEHLIAVGLDLFVVYEADGVTPSNIDYAAFAAVGSLVVGRDLNQRVTAIESLLAA